MTAAGYTLRPAQAGRGAARRRSTAMIANFTRLLHLGNSMIPDRSTTKVRLAMPACSLKTP